MTSYSNGQHAELLAANWLSGRGYAILERNWRTRWCEIDIVARKEQTIYLVEVKYRRSVNFGDGLDYITSAKLNQMQFAAHLWGAEHHWSGNMELAAIAVSGSDYQIEGLFIV